MISKLKNLRMRTQIIIFQIFIFLLVFGIVGLGSLAQMKIFNYTSSQSSERIIYKSDINEIAQTSTFISHLIKQKHQRSIQLTDHIALFIYQYSHLQSRITTLYKLDLCVTQSQSVTREYLKQVQKFCYQIHGKNDLVTINDENGIFLMNSLSFLDNFGLILNINPPNFIQIVDISTPYFDSLFPYGLMVKEYEPKSRPWFINHIANMKNQSSQLFFFSDVYKVMIESNSYQFSLTQSLLNNYQEVFGILKIQLNVTDQDFLNIHHNILLTNAYGQVLFNGLEQRNNITEVFYIYNESITGFNNSDWNLIQQQAQIHDYENSKSQIFVLFDKYFQEYVHVHCEKLKTENFTLIIYTNITSIKTMKNKFQLIEEYFNSNLQITNGILIMSSISLLLIAILIIKYICQPLVALNTQISKHLLTLGNNINQQIFKLVYIKSHQSNNIISDLNYKFQNFYEILQKNQNIKCEQCRLIEKMNYHKKECNVNVSGFKRKFSKLSDSNVKQESEIALNLQQYSFRFQTK